MPSDKRFQFIKNIKLHDNTSYGLSTYLSNGSGSGRCKQLNEIYMRAKAKDPGRKKHISDYAPPKVMPNVTGLRIPADIGSRFMVMVEAYMLRHYNFSAYSLTKLAYSDMHDSRVITSNCEKINKFLDVLQNFRETINIQTESFKKDQEKSHDFRTLSFRECIIDNFTQNKLIEIFTYDYVNAKVLAERLKCSLKGKNYEESRSDTRVLSRIVRYLAKLEAYNPTDTLMKMKDFHAISGILYYTIKRTKIKLYRFLKRYAVDVYNQTLAYAFNLNKEKVRIAKHNILNPESKIVKKIYNTCNPYYYVIADEFVRKVLFKVLDRNESLKSVSDQFSIGERKLKNMLFLNNRFLIFAYIEKNSLDSDEFEQLLKKFSISKKEYLKIFGT